MSKFEFVERLKATYPVTRLCRALGVSPSGYWAWRRRAVKADACEHCTAAADRRYPRRQSSDRRRSLTSSRSSTTANAAIPRSAISPQRPLKGGSKKHRSSPSHSPSTETGQRQRLTHALWWSRAGTSSSGAGNELGTSSLKCCSQLRRFHGRELARVRCSPGAAWDRIVVTPPTQERLTALIGLALRSAAAARLSRERQDIPPSCTEQRAL